MPSERIQRQIDGLFEEIEAAVKQREWEQVRELAEDVLTLDPDNEDAQAFIAVAERGLSRSRRSSTEEVPTPGPPPTETADTPPTIAPAVPGAERRQLTVMFCDLMGSTALSEKLDPEDLREVIRAYQQTCAEVVGRFDSHIAKYIGDGLLVYFGYPQAHEDDARRAVHAGLGIVGEMRRLNQRLGKEHGVDLAVRLGIHTGLVVAGEMGAGEVVEQDAIVGETPNIAARLQELADPNAVVLSARTHRLVEGLFICESLGPQQLKGISEPVPVFRVRGEGGASSRFEAVAERGLTPVLRTNWIPFILKR